MDNYKIVDKNGDPVYGVWFLDEWEIRQLGWSLVPKTRWERFVDGFFSFFS